MARPVLRHGVDPPLHVAVDRFLSDAEHRRPGRRPPTPAGPRRRRCARASSPNRPNDSRTSSTLPRRPHLREVSVIALACSRSPAATSTPDCCGSGVPPGRASTTNAVDATAMRLAAAARSRVRRPRSAAAASARARRAPRRRRASWAPSSSTTSQPSAARSTRSTADPGPIGIDAAGHQFVEQHRVAAVDRAEHRPVDRREARQRVAHRVGEAGRTAVQRGGQRRQRPSAGRSSPPIPRTHRPAAGRPSGRPPARRTGHRRARRPRDRQPSGHDSGRDAFAGASALIVASSTRPASDDACAGMPCNVPCGIGCRRPSL